MSLDKMFDAFDADDAFARAMADCREGYPVERWAADAAQAVTDYMEVAPMLTHGEFVILEAALRLLKRRSQ